MATKTQQTPTSAKYPPHDMCSILSQKKLSKQDVNVASITYSVSASKIRLKHSLMDQGANRGIAGQDVKLIATRDRSVDIQGIDNHQVTDVNFSSKHRIRKQKRICPRLRLDNPSVHRVLWQS